MYMGGIIPCLCCNVYCYPLHIYSRDSKRKVLIPKFDTLISWTNNLMAFNGLSSNELPDYDIVEFSCGSFDGTAKLTIRCYGKQFHIQVSENNLDDDSEIKRDYQRLLRRLDDPTCPEVDSDTDPMEDLCFWIAYKCNSQMRDLASTCPPQVHTLKDWLSLETIVLTMIMKDGQVATKACPPDPSLVANLTHQMELPFSFQTLSIPAIDPSSIRLPLAVESE